MTSADKRRVRKSLEGLQFPQPKEELLTYAEERSAEAKTMTALRALPEGTYQSIDEVEQSVPQSPEAAL